jgi:hypothetical protein
MTSSFNHSLSGPFRSVGPLLGYIAIRSGEEQQPPRKKRRTSSSVTNNAAAALLEQAQESHASRMSTEEFLKDLAVHGNCETVMGRSKFATDEQSIRTNLLMRLRGLVDDAYANLGHPDTCSKGWKKKPLKADWEICRAEQRLVADGLSFKRFHLMVQEECVRERARRGLEESTDVVIYTDVRKVSFYLLSPLAREVRKTLAGQVSAGLHIFDHSVPNSASAIYHTSICVACTPSSTGDSRRDRKTVYAKDHEEICCSSATRRRLGHASVRDLRVPRATRRLRALWTPLSV